MTEKTTQQDYVQVFVPTKDREGKRLPEKDVLRWQTRIREVFRRYVEGFYVSPYYTVGGDYRSSTRNWIREPNYIIKAFAPRDVCHRLIRALETEIVEPMGVDLRQESIAMESSIEGLALYTVQH